VFNELPKRDPSADYARRNIAARRVGNRQCRCGEARPEALIPESDPITCHECQREAEGKSLTDNHHVAGKANDSTTIPVPTNDHVAELNLNQYDWPKQTLENTDGCPLIAGAGRIRGFVDTVMYLIEKLLLPLAKQLETLSPVLRDTLGPKWWVNMDLENFAPKSKKRVL